MKRIAYDALIVSLIDALNKRGSWCGETHIQKASYFLSRLEKGTVPFGFILYKHGPFSFELRDELTAMRAKGFLDLESLFPYGSRFRTTQLGGVLKQIATPAIAKRQEAISFVAEKL